VGLEFGGVLLGKLLGVHLLARILFFDFIAFLIDFFLFGLGLLRSDVKDFKRSAVANRVPVEDVTSVLAIILTQSPSESLAHQRRRDLLLFRILFEVIGDPFSELKRDELIVAVSFIERHLLKFLFIDSLLLILLNAFTFWSFATFLSLWLGLLNWCLFFFLSIVIVVIGAALSI